MIPEILFTASTAADVAFGVYDARQTVKGIKQGAAVEGNPIIKAFAGQKPGMAALCTYNLTWDAAFIVFALIFGIGNPPLFVLLTGPMLAGALKHLVAAKNWKWLMAGGKPQPKQNAFQKFIGLLSWNEE